ncbi:MAG: DUF2357 domain-containing protein [Endozoicomonas sp.]|uniref:DUF2357 domain-containing protein n=1 Tax=Endozoicomonas sp. TaxID=1892382 RepID=UPI003D9B573F
MELYVEVLDGKRKGYRFALPVGEDQVVTESFPFVLESEALAFFLKLDEPCKCVSLCIGELTYAFSQGRNSDFLEYELLPAYRKNGKREALFFNYFGMAFLGLHIETEEHAEVLEVGPVEVLARKVTATQAERMIDFILTETNGQLHKEFGAKKLHASAAEGGERPQKVVEQLLKDTEILEEISQHILHRPLKALASNLTIKGGKEVDVLHEQGITWLMENLSVLEETDDRDRAHLIFDNRAYHAVELQTAVMQDHTDIYENRVLHNYLENLLNFSQEVLDNYSQSDTSKAHNSHQDYVSFFSCMKSWMHKINSHHVTIIQNCRRRLAKIQSIYQRYLPVKHSEEGMPKITAKVRGNRHYLLLFRMIISWYQNNLVDWRSHQLFLAINAMPKLFEYYTVLRVKRWCIESSNAEYNKPIGSMWRGNIYDKDISLFYEPLYWMVGHSNAGEIVNTEHRSEVSSRSDRLGKSRNYEYSRRSPDIVLEVKEEGKASILLVLDAKYTSRSLAFNQYLPDCTMKYVHGLSGWDSRQAVKAMIILYPDVDDKFMDLHVAPFNVFGQYSQIPALGAQALSLSPLSATKGIGFEALLERLVEVCEG